MLPSGNVSWDTSMAGNLNCSSSLSASNSIHISIFNSNCENSNHCSISNIVRYSNYFLKLFETSSFKKLKQKFEKAFEALKFKIESFLYKHLFELKIIKFKINIHEFYLIKVFSTQLFEKLIIKYPKHFQRNHLCEMTWKQIQRKFKSAFLWLKTFLFRFLWEFHKHRGSWIPTFCFVSFSSNVKCK